MTRPENPPSGYEDLSPPKKRTIDVLAAADAALCRREIAHRNHHGQRTVRDALKSLREDGIVEQAGHDAEARWPVPLYHLVG